MESRRIGWVGVSRMRELALVLEHRLVAWREQWQVGTNVQVSVESRTNASDWPEMMPGRYWQVGEGSEAGPLVVAWAEPSAPAAVGAALLGLPLGIASGICDGVGEQAILAMLEILCGNGGTRSVQGPHSDLARGFGADAASMHVTLRIAQHSIEWRAGADWCDRLVPVTRVAPVLMTRGQALEETRVPVSFRLPLGEVAIADMTTLSAGDILLAEPNVIELLGEVGGLLASGRLVRSEHERAVAIL